MIFEKNEYREGKLWNGYDQEHKAFVRDGVYVRCGKPDVEACQCYGHLHAGDPCTVNFSDQMEVEEMQEDKLREELKEERTLEEGDHIPADYAG